MGFTKTSEGRVFFQNADNDDLPAGVKSSAVQAASPKKTPDPVMPRDNTQMQILMLLKSLNTKLKSSRGDQEVLKKQVQGYKTTIASLEKKTLAQESNYIDLEQTVARKQNEASKKAQRVEANVKKTLDQLEEAKDLVKALEARGSSSEDALKSLKEQVSLQIKKDEKIILNQKTLEKIQKDQGEKMVDSLAAYVALTKRVSESETRHEAMDNKIEDARSDYIKLDRKIDRAIEDRNRILRKIERIEQAVLETRDALNAKAMVLLTDQGVAGVDAPSLSDEAIQTSAAGNERHMQGEALLPWWRRSLRVQSVSLALILISTLMLGWIISEIRRPVFTSPVLEQAAPPPSISLGANEIKENSYDWNQEAASTSLDVSDSTYGDSAYDLGAIDTDIRTPLVEPNYTDDVSDGSGITIHRGYSDPADIQNKSAAINVYDSASLSDAFDQDPDFLATALNDIEPGNPSLKTPAIKPDVALANNTAAQSIVIGETEDFAASKNRIEPTSGTPEKEVLQKVVKIPPAAIQPPARNEAYIKSLKSRVSPDKNLTDIAKKIEAQAFDGVPEAQHDLGAIYVAGHGKTPQDLERAIFWFTEASNNEVSNATYNLGVLYHQGVGVEANMARAIELYKKASDTGHAEAQYNLGIANIEGIGVTYSPSRAARYFQQAAEGGIIEAAYNLGLIYENGLLGQPQPDEALSWYKYAADKGSPEAQTALEQLAASLGIGINDVSRIVDKVHAQKSQKRILSGSASTSADGYLVAQIQEELMRRGLYPGPVDGMIGPMTRDAIKGFQTAANLHVNGTPSQELLGYLQATAQ